MASRVEIAYPTSFFESVGGLALLGALRLAGETLRGLGIEAEAAEAGASAEAGGVGESGTGEGTCFVAGTKVLTPDGERSIESLKVGEMVLACDPERGVVESRAVLQTFERQTPVVLDIQVGGEVITCTPEHPFWVPEKGWVNAGELEVGVSLLTREGEIVGVEAIEPHEGLFTVYNFEVEELHTYFVSNLSILVHNTCNFDPRKLQHEYKHAPDFGVVGNWNNANRALFQQSIENFVTSAPTQIQGTYRNTVQVTHYFDPSNNLWVAVDTNGNFVAGWKLSPAQVSNLLTRGNVQ